MGLPLALRLGNHPGAGVLVGVDFLGAGVPGAAGRLGVAPPGGSGCAEGQSGSSTAGPLLEAFLS